MRQRPLQVRHTSFKRADPFLPWLYALAAGAFAAWFLQFFTGLFDGAPSLGIAACVALAAFAVVVGMQAAAHPHALWRAGGMVAGLAIALAAAWAAHTKISYGGTYHAHPRYNPPHGRTPLPDGARVVRLTCSDGVGVDGVYLAGRRKAAIVVYPSWLSGKDGFAIASLARWLAPQFAVLVLDPRGVGGSGGFQRGAGDGRHDIQAAAAFLRKQGMITVGVLGEGDAAIAAALSAADAPERAAPVPPEARVDAVMLAGPTSVWGESPPGSPWWDDPRTAFGRLYWRVAAGIRLGRSPGPTLADVMPQIHPKPVLVLTHPGDAAKAAQQLYLAAGEPRGFRLVPGSGRPMDWGTYPAYFGAARDWFRRVLAPPPAPAPAVEAAAATAPTPTPEQRQLEQMLADPQPLVPDLPPAGGVAATAGAAPVPPIVPAPDLPTVPRAPGFRLDE